MPRRVPAIVAGVLAVVASLTTLAAVVVADIADASTQVETLSDELPVPPPVTMTHIEHPPEPELPDLPDFMMPQREPTRHGKRVNFGSFEGY
jgi:hypothetical protein